MARFVKVTRLGKLREGKGSTFTVGGREVALFLVNGKIHAVENLCPHQHIPVLDEGCIAGTILTCPMHGWQFDLSTGLAVNAGSRLTEFEVRIVGGDVHVAIPEEDTEPWW